MAQNDTLKIEFKLRDIEGWASIGNGSFENGLTLLSMKDIQAVSWGNRVFLWDGYTGDPNYSVHDGNRWFHNLFLTNAANIAEGAI